MQYFNPENKHHVRNHREYLRQGRQHRTVKGLLEKQTPEQEEGYRAFLNMLKIFHNIDAPDLGHIFNDDKEFGSFRTDPFDWFIQNQGDRARAVYQLAMERQWIMKSWVRVRAK